MTERESLTTARSGVHCEAPPKPCAWPDCDCDCNCFVPALDGAGQHSPSCRCVQRTPTGTPQESGLDACPSCGDLYAMCDDPERCRYV